MAFRQTERAVDRGIVWTLGLQALSREWLTLPLDAFRNGFDSLQLLGCRTPQDVVTVQSGLMWSGVEQVLARGDRIARISTQLAHEAGMPAPQAPVGDKG
jgi:hypothetical protein